MRRSDRPQFHLLLVAICLGCAAGCGSPGAEDMPELGTVNGMVTLDGNPLPNATVTFYPEKSRASFGITDAEGLYSLIYTPEQPGAAVGHHSVKITTAEPQSPEGSETLPAAYNTETTLSADVEPGENKVNFDLKSQP